MATITEGWYKGSIPFYNITEISISTSGSGIESWDASTSQDGSIMCYRNETSVNIVCNNLTAVGDNAFFKFLALKRVSGLGSVTTVGEFAFCYTPNLAYIDLVPGKLTSIGASAFRMSSAEDNLDLSSVSTSIIGDKGTRLKRWSASGLSAVKNIVFPKKVYLEVANPDNQMNYSNIPFGTDNGVMKYADRACSALSAYHVWNYLSKGTSKEYDNWLDWYNATLNADGTFAETNEFDSEMFENIVTKLGWTLTGKTRVNDSQQLQSIIDALVNGVPTILSIHSTHSETGKHAIVAIGCDPETHKLAIVDSHVVGTSGVVSWIAFEDIFVSGTEETDGIYHIDYKRPILAAGSTWYTQGGTTKQRSTITEIYIKDTYTPTGTVTESWDASASKNGSVKVYLENTKLTIVGNGSGKLIANADSSYMFSDASKSYFSNLVSIHGGNLLDTANVTNMSYMFNRATALEAIDVGSWDTSKVTTMKCMFQNALAIGGLDVSKWNTSACADMLAMFNMGSANTNLTTLDVSKWDVSKITNMQNMFTYLSGLTSLDLSNWNVGNVTNMKNTFAQCSSLTTIGDVSNWNVSKVTNMYGLFNACSSLLILNMSKWDMSKVTDNMFMFGDMYSLEKIVVGENFRFNVNGITTNGAGILPTPNPNYIEGADGRWYDVNGNAIAPTAVPSKTFGVYYAASALVVEDANRLVLVKNGSLLRTAVAIRTKNGTAKGYTPAEFADAILNV